MHAEGMHIGKACKHVHAHRHRHTGTDMQTDTLGHKHAHSHRHTQVHTHTVTQTHTGTYTKAAWRRKGRIGRGMPIAPSVWTQIRHLIVKHCTLLWDQE